MSNYINKYIKYKNKYLYLKNNNNLLGGFHNKDEILNDNDIYCGNTHTIVPHKKQMVKFLDIVEKKLLSVLQQKTNEMTIVEEGTKKSRLIKKIKEIQEQIQYMCDDKDKNYCNDTTRFTTSYGPDNKTLMDKYHNGEFKVVFKNLLLDIKPITFLSNNFYPIEEPNFVVYIKIKIYRIEYNFEIYKNITNDNPPVYYLLTPIYELNKTDIPIDLKEKSVSYPLFDSHYINLYNDRRRYIIEGYILANNQEKLINIIKMYYSFYQEAFAKWIHNFVNYTLIAIIHHESFKVMDAFTISNNYNIYYDIYQKILTLNISHEEHIQINKTLINCITNDDEINGDSFEIINLILHDILPIKKELIDTYNCGKINYLAQILIKDTTKLFTNNLKELNKYLNFSHNQIFLSIIYELYNELYDFIILRQHVPEHDLLCILQSIYYYRIYNLSNVKNLINYELQFLTMGYTSIYTPNIMATSPLEKLYKSFSLAIPNYYNFKHTDIYSKIDVPKIDGTVKSNWPICGEITILNLINLLILNKSTGKLDFTLLPESTIDLLKDFYKRYDNIDNLKSPLVISEYMQILWNIPFPIIRIDGIIDTKYNVYHEYDGNISEKGAEIIPSYENICRILSYIFRLATDIYNYEGSELKSLNINSNTLKEIFEYVKSEYAREMVANYEYNESQDNVTINLKNLGIITLNKLHAEYNITQSCNNILIEMNYYVQNETNLIKMPLHYGYCGILGFDYIYTYNELSDEFIDFYIVMINNNFVLNFNTVHIILNYIFDKKPHEYEQIITKNEIYRNLFKYYEDYYQFFWEVQNENLIYRFINKIVLNTRPNNYIFDITSKKMTNIFIKCSLNIISQTDIEKYKLHFDFLQIFAFFNDTENEFPYFVTIKHFGTSEFSTFNVIFEKYDLFLYDCNEKFIICFLLDSDTSVEKIINDNMIEKFPNLLINLLSYKNIKTNSSYTKYKNYGNIVIKLINNFRYKLVPLNSDNILFISQIKIDDKQIQDNIIEKYIEYLCTEEINNEICKNFINNYNLILYIKQHNPIFTNDMFNDIMKYIANNINIYYDNKSMEYYMDFLLYLLRTKNISKEDIIIILNLYSLYIEKNPDILKKILVYIPLIDLSKTLKIKWNLIFSHIDELDIEITFEIVENIIELIFKTSYKIPKYDKLPQYDSNTLSKIWHNLLFVNTEPINYEKINLYFNLMDYDNTFPKYIAKYINFIKENYGTEIKPKLLENLDKILKNDKIEQSAITNIMTLYYYFT
jgi:hypothetical protein